MHASKGKTFSAKQGDCREVWWWVFTWLLSQVVRGKQWPSTGYSGHEICNDHSFFFVVFKTVALAQKSPNCGLGILDIRLCPITGSDQAWLMMHSETARPWPTICVCFLYEIWLDNKWTIEWMNEWTNNIKKDIKHKQACASELFHGRYLVELCYNYTIAKMISTLFNKKIFFSPKRNDYVLE